MIYLVVPFLLGFIQKALLDMYFKVNKIIVLDPTEMKVPRRSFFKNERATSIKGPKLVGLSIMDTLIPFHEMLYPIEELQF